MTKNGLIDYLKKYKELYLLLVFFIGLIWTIFNEYDKFLDKNDELLETLQTTQQMALKSVIWNDNIPYPERMSACDVYLEAGYNSLTKKHCSEILKESE